MLIDFAKYVGCGNDFILIDNRLAGFPLKDRKIISALCCRRYGIGADGLLLMENSDRADARMRIFNQDGSEAEMCGNGLRCFVKWLCTKGMKRPLYQIEVGLNLYTASLKGNDVVIDLCAPLDYTLNLPFLFQNKSWEGHYIDTGVPHVIFFSREPINLIDLELCGPFFRSHDHWGPQGTNVNLAEVLSPSRLKIRTYERGVGETLACGTGAVASALIAGLKKEMKSPITIETQSGKELVINFCLKNGIFSEVTLLGEALSVFSGVIDV
jgi:diaminopimelate epimerase